MASTPRLSSIALRFLLYFVLVVPGFVSFPGMSGAAMQITLAWDANSEPDLEGYRLHARQVNRDYNYSSPSCDGSETSCTIYDLVETVEHCFVVRAYDADGNESADSNEVCLPPSQADPADIDDDGDGFTENQGDCNDGAAGIYPGAAEVCGDGIDQNCDGSDSTCANVIADAGPDKTETAGDPVTLDGSNSHDPDGSIASYLWTQMSGPTIIMSGEGTSTLNFIAPEFVSDDNILVFSLTVEGSDGSASTDTCVVIVTQQNQPPVADAGPDQKVAVNDKVALNGSNSTSSDDGALTYSWKQASGLTVDLSDPLASSPTFIAPAVEKALVFDLTVTDANGSASTDSCIVNVSIQNEPPTANAGSDIVAASNQTVFLDGTGSLDDGQAVSHSWSQTEGPPVTLSDANSASPYFISPTVGAEGASLTFQLMVTDQGGLKDTDSCIVNVTSQNQPPEAVTNEYVETTPDMVVTLDGTLSTDIDDGIESYRWHQLEGPPVTFDDPKAAQLKFSAPSSGPYGSNMLFALKVKDKGGLKKSAKCAVFVQPESSGPAKFTVLEPIISLFQKGSFYQAKASVFVFDGTGGAVKDAAVKGRWLLPGLGEFAVSGYTSGAGEAKLDSERFKQSGTLYFKVTEISIGGETIPVDTGSNIIVP